MKEMSDHSALYNKKWQYDNYYASLVSTVSEYIRNMNQPCYSYQTWAGRSMSVFVDYGWQEYQLQFLVSVNIVENDDEQCDDHDNAKFDIIMEVPWPDNYPMTPLQNKWFGPMAVAKVRVDRSFDTCTVLYLGNTASTYPSLATQHEKVALSGIVSDMLSMEMLILCESQSLTPRGRVSITAKGSLGLEPVSIDHVPYATRDQRQYVLRDFFYMNPYPLTEHEELIIIQHMVKTEVLVKIYEELGFRIKSGRQDPTRVKMKATLSTLVKRCHDRFGIDPIDEEMEDVIRQYENIDIV